jgi:hypothetical protein
LSIVGRRGSSGSAWNWSRPASGSLGGPATPPHPPSIPPLLPLAGAAIVALLVVAALLAIWLSDGDDDAPGLDTDTPTPAATTPVPTATARPTPTPTPTSTPSPVPTITPAAGGEEPDFSLGVWDGAAWRFEAWPAGATVREGEAIPFLLRIDGARPGDGFLVAIVYDCSAFDFLTAYDRDNGSNPAFDFEGPGSAIPDSALSIPDDAGTPADDGNGGSLSLWGASFGGVGGPLPPTACTGEKSLTVGLTAAADTAFLMWGADVSPGTEGRDAPLKLTVRTPGVGELIVEIGPESVRPAP